MIHYYVIALDSVPVPLLDGAAVVAAPWSVSLVTWWLLSSSAGATTAASDTSGLSRDLARPLFPLLDGAAVDHQTF